MSITATVGRAVLSPIQRFNCWFDGLEPTTRFPVFMLAVAPSGAVLRMGITLESWTLALLGLCWFVLVLLVAAVRAFNISSNRRTHATIGFVLIAAVPGVIGLVTLRLLVS